MHKGCRGGEKGNKKNSTFGALGTLLGFESCRLFGEAGEGCRHQLPPGAPTALARGPTESGNSPFSFQLLLLSPRLPEDDF